MLAQLWLPIILSGVALFFASFLSWMVLGLHKPDWSKVPDEPALTKALIDCRLERGKSYMLPSCDDPARMKTKEFQDRLAAGPNGVFTIFPAGTGMGMKLVLTFVYFLFTSLVLAYLGTIAFGPGEQFEELFRFFATAGLLTHLAAMVPQSIWFKNRIVGHTIESVAYSLILGGIFAYFWPAA
jgi:hypothetical protein